MSRSATRNKVGIDNDYKAWIARLPCIICMMTNNRQTVRTEVAHIGARGLGQKCPDRQTAPLCGEHHRTGKYSHHVIGKKFWGYWKIDRELLIAELNRLYDDQPQSTARQEGGAS